MGAVGSTEDGSVAVCVSRRQGYQGSPPTPGDTDLSRHRYLVLLFRRVGDGVSTPPTPVGHLNPSRVEGPSTPLLHFPGISGTPGSVSRRRRVGGVPVPPVTEGPHLMPTIIEGRGVSGKSSSFQVESGI